MVFWQNGKKYGSFMMADLNDRVLRSTEARLNDLVKGLDEAQAKFKAEYDRIQLIAKGQEPVEAYIDAVLLSKRSLSLCRIYSQDVRALFERIKEFDLDAYKTLDAFKPLQVMLDSILKAEAFALSCTVLARGLGSKESYQEVTAVSQDFGEFIKEVMKFEAQYYRQVRKNRTNTHASKLELDGLVKRKKRLESIYRSAAAIYHLSRKHKLTQKDIAKLGL